VTSHRNLLGHLPSPPGGITIFLSFNQHGLAILYQKLHHRLYGPLTAGIVEPVASDNQMLKSRKARLDRLYEAVDKALHKLSAAVGVVA
jgi:hypothetical protein